MNPPITDHLVECDTDALTEQAQSMLASLPRTLAEACRAVAILSSGNDSPGPSALIAAHRQILSRNAVRVKVGTSHRSRNV